MGKQVLPPAAAIPSSLLPLLVAVLLLGPVEAQLPDGNWSAFSSMEVVNDIVPAGGMVWAATDGGVLRYDVSERTYSRFTRVDGLAGSRVLTAVADRGGDLWFGTSGEGLSRYVVASGEFAGPFSEFEGLKLNDLAVIDGRLYIASNIGVSLFLTDVERVKENYRQFGDMMRDSPVAAVVVHDGRIWAGTEVGVAWAELTNPNLQDPKAWATEPDVGAVADLMVASDTLFAAGGGSVWRWDASAVSWTMERGFFGDVISLGMHDGKVVALTTSGRMRRRETASRWNGISGPPTTVNAGVGELRTLSRLGTAMWVGTVNGLAVLGEQAPPPLGDPPANHYYEMAMTAAGDLWVSSAPNDQTVPPKGMFQYDGTRWWVHDHTNGISTDITVAVATDSRDQLWVGTWGDGVAVLDSQGRWRYLDQSNSVLRGITEPDAPTFVVVSDIDRDSDGNMWCANIQGGLAVMDGYPPQQSYLNLQRALGIGPGRNISKLAIGPDDLKWVGTTQDGLILFDDGGTPFVSGDDRAVVINTGFDGRLGSDRVTAVFANQPGVVWVGTDNGLDRIRYAYDSRSGAFEIDSWRQYRLHNGLLSLEVTDIEGDADDNIWVGTRSGLTQLKSSGQFIFTYTTENSRLIDDRVESLLFDAAAGEVWIGTFNGIARLQRDRSTAVAGARPIAYPNPLRVGRAGNQLTISGLAEGSIVRIYTLDGQLVRQLETLVKQTTVAWDGRNERGDTVGSGIFLFVATDRGGGSVSGKVAVVRKG